MLGVLIRLVAGRNARTFSHASGVQPVLREKFVAEVDRYPMAFICDTRARMKAL
ncbi:hypothetical protein [Paraburkholderia sp. SIMBA_054]|jgi:hypothetical protein|uniref:hypothetical protein n=1 Tax=Paraburkholderia sp. SIMBA_054 TaxID=3085795 RepID=UPI00397D2C8D